MKKLILCLVFIVSILFSVVGCTKNSKVNNGGTQTLKVEVFDRNAAPEGQGTTLENKWTKYLKDEVKKIGIDLQFEACPRAQESEKLNIWLASGTSPDIIFTYNINAMYSYAEQGGLYDLKPFINKSGNAIKEKLAETLPYGEFNGKQYGIPGKSVEAGISPLKIRKDWLDKLSLAMPTTIDELHTVLKAFKQKDPGNVGKENVVPFAIPAPGVVGTPGFYLDLMFPFGIRNDAGGFSCLVGGNYNAETGEFKSPVDTQEAREFYRFMNTLYKEGLIHKEFAVDNNGSRYQQHVSSGLAGFVDCNGVDIDNLTVAAVPTVDWALMEPLKDKDGAQQILKPSPVRWLNMVPAKSKVPEAAVKYIDWMIENKIDTTLYNGIEGVHYDLKDGLIMTKDQNFSKNDLNWIGNDLNLIGAVNYSVPKDRWADVYTGKKGLKQIKALEFFEKFAPASKTVILNSYRPVAQDKASQLQSIVFQGAAKVIVAQNFDEEYSQFIENWKKMGGEEYDKEIATIIKDKGGIK